MPAQSLPLPPSLLTHGTGLCSPAWQGGVVTRQGNRSKNQGGDDGISPRPRLFKRYGTSSTRAAAGGRWICTFCSAHGKLQGGLI
jgi:hypothetical protein